MEEEFRFLAFLFFKNNLHIYLFIQMVKVSLKIKAIIAMTIIITIIIKIIKAQCNPASLIVPDFLQNGRVVLHFQ